MPSEYWLHPLARRGRCPARRSCSRSSTRAVRHAHHRAPRARAPRGRGGRGCCADASSSTPTRRPGVGQLAVAGRRARGACPRPGGESPTSIRSVVVLPAPLGPRKPVTVPGSQRKRDVADDGAAAEALREAVGFDHGAQHRRRGAAGAHPPPVDPAIDFGRGSASARATYIAPRWRHRSTALAGRATLLGGMRGADAPLGPRLGGRRRCCSCSRSRSACSSGGHVVRARRRRRAWSTSRVGVIALRRALVAPLAARSASPRSAIALGTRLRARGGAARRWRSSTPAIRVRAPRARVWRSSRRSLGGALPLIYPDPERPSLGRDRARRAVDRASPSAGGCSCARSATSCTTLRERAEQLEAEQRLRESRRARPSGGGSPARCTTCSPTGSRC